MGHFHLLRSGRAIVEQWPISDGLVIVTARQTHHLRAGQLGRYSGVREEHAETPLPETVALLVSPRRREHVTPHVLSDRPPSPV